MKLRRRGLLLLIALAVLPAAAQADSGFGRFHALVIGNQNYRHLTTLQTPLADAKAVAEVLKTQYGFTVDLLLDKSRDEIKLALSELRKTMTDERDNLLIYYAGHGYLDKVTGTGYWQPVDAEKDNDVYWLPTDEISRLLKAVRARHVLIVADSCYSGSLLMRDSGARLPAAASRDEWLKRMQARRSRTALTSGGEEPVADGGGSGHSVFAKALLEVLRENKEILDGDSLFDRLKRPVILNAEQTPLYGDIKMTGHEMGDFLLVPKELQEGGIQEKSEGKADLNFLKRNNGIQTDLVPPEQNKEANFSKKNVKEYQSNVVEPGWLGLIVQDIDEELAKSFNLDKANGVLVSDVTSSSPAEKAGFHQGDIIIAINGTLLTEVSDLRNRIAITAPGTPVTLDIIRDGRRQQINVLIAKQPSDDRGLPRGFVLEKLGLTLQNMTLEEAVQLGDSKGKQVIVTKVEANSPADNVGIEAGQLIEEVNRVNVSTLADLQDALKKDSDSKQVLLRVRSGEYSRYVTIKYE